MPSVSCERKTNSSLRLACFLLLNFILINCNSSSLSNESSQQYLSKDTYYLADGSSVRLYYKTADGYSLITLLTPTNGMLSLPTSVKTGDYGERKDYTTPRSLELYASIHVENHPSGDFYFESPVLGPELTITNVTTALSWYLKYGFNGQNVKVSKEAFDQMALSIEVICTDCRKKTNSEVLSLILNRETLKEKIQQNLQSQNPNLTLTPKWQNPPNLFAWSEPAIHVKNVSLNISTEGKSINSWIAFLNTEKSTQPIYPVKWTHTFKNISEDLLTKKIAFPFNYEHMGTHSFKPIFEFSSDPLNFQFEVGNINRNPICDNPIDIPMRSNVLSIVPLTNFCRDLDQDEPGLSFNLISGPNASTITTVGSLRWTPPQRTGTPTYSEPIQFSVNDSYLGFLNTPATIRVSPDNEPRFDSFNSSYSFTEGSEGSFTVTASDLDGDPLRLVIEPVTPIELGFPTGAGNLANIDIAGSNGNHSFTVRFTPSYLQTVAADGNSSVRLVLYYQSNGFLNSSLRFDEKIINFQITNTDDPPKWVNHPSDITATEGIDLGGIILGMAEDPSPNPSTITYSLMNRSGTANCNWGSSITLTTNVAGEAVATGSPPHFASEVCSFVIRAMDTKYLAFDSAPFTITTTNTNQPITLLPSPLLSVNGQETKVLILPLDQMFFEPDLISDPIDLREELSWTCLVDADTNGSYESTCDSLGLDFSFLPNSLNPTWRPPQGTAGTYHLRITATDVGGVSVSHDFDLIIDEYPAPMTLTTLFAGNPTTQFTVAEGGVYSLTLHAEPATGRPVDSYNFSLINPTCTTVVGGNAPCRANLIASPGSLTGSGETLFNFTITTNFTDGNAPLPATSKTYLVNFFGFKDDDTNVSMERSVRIVVTNTNRNPTSIAIGSSGSFGCLGSSPNSDPDPFSVCVDLSKDKKIGNTWYNQYSLNLSAIDPDGEFDVYSFSLPEELTPATINDNILTIRMPRCMNPSNGNVLRSYPLTVSDGRGGTFSRTLNLKVLKASASTNCL